MNEKISILIKSPKNGDFVEIGLKANARCDLIYENKMIGMAMIYDPSKLSFLEVYGEVESMNFGPLKKTSPLNKLINKIKKIVS